MRYDIILVGCGATGSNLYALLAQYMKFQSNINKIILVDQDVVERKNTKNQRFLEKDIGLNKARVLAGKVKGINVSYYDKFITDKKQLIEIAKDCKNTLILVGAVDNNKARQCMNDFFYDDSIPSLIYIDTGNGDGENRKGQTVCGVKKDNKIIKFPVGEYYPEIFEEEKEEEVSYTCSEVDKHPQSFATNVFSATVVFLFINNIASNIPIKKTMIKFNADYIQLT